jgi:hypothetical protein
VKKTAAEAFILLVTLQDEKELQVPFIVSGQIPYFNFNRMNHSIIEPFYQLIAAKEIAFFSAVKFTVPAYLIPCSESG